MTDPFENYSTILRMRQSRFGGRDTPESEVVESKPSTTNAEDTVFAYENVDNYPAVLRIREERDPSNSLSNCDSFSPLIVKDNTMVTGSRQRVEARTPYYQEVSERTERTEADSSGTDGSSSNTEQEDSETQSEGEASDSAESRSNTDESSEGSTVESLPIMTVPPGRTQPNLMIPSAMSLEDEKRVKYVAEDPIHEITITESNILESFSFNSYSRARSRDTFDDDEKTTEAPPTRVASTPRKPSSPLEASIMAMDDYYKRIKSRPIVRKVDPIVEEMKQIMLGFWMQDQCSATILFSVSWQLTRRFQSICECNIEEETGLVELPPIPLDDQLLWQMFQRFLEQEGEIVIPQYLCPPAVEEFMIFDWSNEIEGMESEEISECDLAMHGLLSVDRVLSLEDFDEDEIFKFRKCISDEYRIQDQGTGLSDDDQIPALSDDEHVFRYRGCVEESQRPFESESSMPNSNLPSPDMLSPLAPFNPFSTLEKIVEEASSNGETESNTTSNREDRVLPTLLCADLIGAALNAVALEGGARSTQLNGEAIEDDTRSNDFTVEDSLDAIIMISGKSAAEDDANDSNGETLEYSLEDTENSGDWGNAYGSSLKRGKLGTLPIAAAFDMAMKGIRSMENENNSAREGPRRTKEGSIRSRDGFSIASEQTNLPEDCLPENLVDRFLTTLEVALCLR